MSYSYKEFEFESVAEGQQIFTRLYEPDEPKAVLQIVHGMAEHSALYCEFAEYLAGKDIAVVIDDHLGHGKTAKDKSGLGYFFDGGINNVIEDERELFSRMSARFYGVPYFIMGHSMGSFIVREYTARYPLGLSGAIYMGTAAGVSPVVWSAEKLLFRRILNKQGDRAYNDLITKLATSSYVKEFPDSPNSWVSSNPDEVRKYTEDPLCGFPMTVSAYKEIASLIQSINSPEWYTRLDKNLPILMLSGVNDPVGGMGKGVASIASKLEKSGHNVKCKIYRKLRHALITETEEGKAKVFADILDFISGNSIDLEDL